MIQHLKLGTARRPFRMFFSAFLVISSSVNISQEIQESNDNSLKKFCSSAP